MTVTVNNDFNTTLTEPLTTVFIDPLDSEEESFTADVADVLTPGIGFYVTGGTQPNDVTPCTAGFGSIAQQNTCYVMDIEGYSPDYPSPNYHMPNTSVTLATYAKAANRPLKGRKLKIGMKMWMIIAVNAGGAATKDETLVFTTSGILARVGDPDGAAIDKVALGFKVLATVASANWVPVEYIGKQTFDNTA